jgi:hypothetical protein
MKPASRPNRTPDRRRRAWSHEAGIAAGLTVLDGLGAVPLARLPAAGSAPSASACPVAPNRRRAGTPLG